MKTALLLLTFVFTNAVAQKDELKKVLEKVDRDSTDHNCALLFDDYYESFESDEGFVNPRMQTAIIKTFEYPKRPDLKNKHLVALLSRYTASTSNPKEALFWIGALEEEYFGTYGKDHPLILLYKGESMINQGRSEEAHNFFLNFQKQFPKSVMAVVYIYKTESDKKMARTWLSILKKLHPNHWVVKTLREE